MRVWAASFQLGGMVEPVTCRTAPDSPILASIVAVASVSIGILRRLATVRDTPICSGASRIVANPSLSRTLDGPSTRRVVSGLSLNWGKLVPPSEDYSIWSTVSSSETGWICGFGQAQHGREWSR